ncbi:MAG: sulfatase [Verrucomicrobiales bacterium]
MRPIPPVLFTLLATVMLSTGQAAIKNVLFLISDDLKASVLGCYGGQCHTPNIDKLAGSSLVFERAYCQGTSCGPSRTSFMHSRYRGSAEVNLGEHFKENGRYSARVGKIYHMRVPGDIIAGTDGNDIASSWTEKFNSPGQEAHTPGDYACLNLNVFTREPKGRQSTRMPHRMFVTVSYEGDGSDQPDHKTATKVIELLHAHKEQPFFIAAGFIRPHYPMVQPERYFAPYPWQKMKLPRQQPGDIDDIPRLGRPGIHSAGNPIGKFPDNQKRMWSGYYAATQFMDEQLGRVLNELERLGLRESTVIVFTSDHGYHLGEHTFWQKSNLHEEVIRVPLIVSVPGMAAGRTQSITELVDLFPTLCELTGLRVPESVQGTSLVPVLKDHAAEVKDSALSFSRGTSLRLRDWAYMRYSDGSEELYDMVRDSGQFSNLAGSSRDDHVRELGKIRAIFNRRAKAAGLKPGKLRHQQDSR